MQREWFIPWDKWKAPSLTFSCPCCRKVNLMPTEEELEQITTAMIDREETENRVLSLNIENTFNKKAVEA